MTYTSAWLILRIKIITIHITNNYDIIIITNKITIYHSYAWKYAHKKKRNERTQPTYETSPIT